MLTMSCYAGCYALFHSFQFLYTSLFLDIEASLLFDFCTLKSKLLLALSFCPYLFAGLRIRWVDFLCFWILLKISGKPCNPVTLYFYFFFVMLSYAFLQTSLINFYIMQLQPLYASPACFYRVHKPHYLVFARVLIFKILICTLFFECL